MYLKTLTYFFKNLSSDRSVSDSGKYPSIVVLLVVLVVVLLVASVVVASVVGSSVVVVSVVVVSVSTG